MTNETVKNEKKAAKSKKAVRAKSADNTLAFFLGEINKIPLLSREEEEKTAKEAAAGDKRAREKLINANLRFVVNIAKKYQSMGLQLEELIAEGNVGLVNAVDRFDVRKNCRFISYAVWWIRQSILSALCEKSRMIRLPMSRASELVKIEKAKKIIMDQKSAEDEAKEIAGLLNMDKERVTDLLGISREILSLDVISSQNQDSPLVDLIEDNKYTTPDMAAVHCLMADDIENMLKTLSKNEADIIRNHYGLGQRPQLTLTELGMKYDLTKERIRQIEEKALTRLKNPVRGKKLQMYVA
ncbi:MAG: RNA polymerase sigma factor RpoD/SigA [Treponema sp.]|nr:RNA polymerase sigma factor RpoD/SigA [Treponema sp.]